MTSILFVWVDGGGGGGGEVTAKTLMVKDRQLLIHIVSGLVAETCQECLEWFCSFYLQELSYEEQKLCDKAAQPLKKHRGNTTAI